MPRIFKKSGVAAFDLDLDINFRTIFKNKGTEKIRMYLSKMWITGDAIDVQKSYSLRQGKRFSRSVRSARTTEAMQKYNEKLAFRELTRTINANFSTNDIHLTLTYQKEERPENEEKLKQDLKSFLRRLRRKCKQAGAELKYITVSAIGKRGAPHHHLIINEIDTRLLNGLWKKGGIHPVFLYSKVDFSGLAEYFIKQANPDGGAVIGRRWNCSRNIIHPKAKVTEVDAETWREPPTAIEGYEIDYNTVEYGENPFTGIPYCYYRMIKREIKKPIMTPDGRLLQPDAADRWLRQKEFEAEQKRYNKDFKIQRIKKERMIR